jgi:hypothetical protein
MLSIKFNLAATVVMIVIVMVMAGKMIMIRVTLDTIFSFYNCSTM